MLGAAARSAHYGRRTNRRRQTRAALSPDLVPSFPLSSATSVRSVSHYSKIVLGVLVEVLGFDPITIRHRLACKCQVPFVILVRVACPVLALTMHGSGAAGRRRSSLRPRVPAPAPVHPVISRWDLRAMPLRMQEPAASRMERWAPAPLESGTSAPHDAYRLGNHFASICKIHGIPSIPILCHTRHVRDIRAGIGQTFSKSCPRQESRSSSCLATFAAPTGNEQRVP
jgi:hypothetical protein